MKNPTLGEDDQNQVLPAATRMHILPFGNSIGQLSDTERILYALTAVVLSFLSGLLSLQAERFSWYGPEVGLAVGNGVIVVILLRTGVLPVRATRRKEDLPPKSHQMVKAGGERLAYS